MAHKCPDIGGVLISEKECENRHRRFLLGYDKYKGCKGCQMVCTVQQEGDKKTRVKYHSIRGERPTDPLKDERKPLPLCACGCGQRCKTPGAEYLAGHRPQNWKQKPTAKFGLCACGCGNRVKTPGKKFIQGHNARKKPPKEECFSDLPFCDCGCGERVKTPGSTFCRGHGTRKRYSSIRQGKDITIPLCACGCGRYVKKPGNKYLKGHGASKVPCLPVSDLPFCKCGCGKRVKSKGCEYRAGHQSGGDYTKELHKGEKERSPVFGPKPAATTVCLVLVEVPDERIEQFTKSLNVNRLRHYYTRVKKDSPMCRIFKTVGDASGGNE